MPRWNVWPAVKKMVQMSCSVVFCRLPVTEAHLVLHGSIHITRFVTDARSHNCEDNVVPSKMSPTEWKLRLVRPFCSRNCGSQVVQAHQKENSSLWPLQPLWYEKIKISPLVFDTVGSHASSFVCLLGLYKPFLVKCSHTGVPRPLRLRTKQTKGLFAPALTHSCDEA